MKPGLKIAVSGKGGVGKTTISALLCRVLAAKGLEVLAVDADSNANLAHGLGVPNPDEVPVLAEMKELIEERTGARKGSFGSYFQMNPQVADIPERFSVPAGKNIRLLTMGSVKTGGGGCSCPEFVFVKSLVAHLVLNSSQALVMDLEAGLEHLGRGVAASVDRLLIVVNPDRVSLLTGRRIVSLAKDLGIPSLRAVANKTAGPEDLAYLKSGIPVDIIASFPYSPTLQASGREGRDGIPEDVRPELESLAKYLTGES